MYSMRLLALALRTALFAGNALHAALFAGGGGSFVARENALVVNDGEGLVWLGLDAMRAADLYGASGFEYI